MTVDLGKVGDMLTVAQWIKVRNAVAARMEGGVFATGVAFHARAENIMKAGYVDVSAVLKSLEPKNDQAD